MGTRAKLLPFFGGPECMMIDILTHYEYVRSCRTSLRLLAQDAEGQKLVYFLR